MPDQDQTVFAEMTAGINEPVFGALEGENALGSLGGAQVQVDPVGKFTVVPSAMSNADGFRGAPKVLFGQQGRCRQGKAST